MQFYYTYYSPFWYFILPFVTDFWTTSRWGGDWKTKMELSLANDVVLLARKEELSRMVSNIIAEQEVDFERRT